ncbi:MAG: hypothetical protein ABI776_15160 [Nocardioidaceae bacterium]
MSSIPWAMNAVTRSASQPVVRSNPKISAMHTRAPITSSSPAAKPCIITRRKSRSATRSRLLPNLRTT